MNALTIHQPWAAFIAAGIKTIETRSWCAPKNAIGEQLAIHAGRRPIKWQEHSEWENKAAELLLSNHPEYPRGDDCMMASGQVIAGATLADCKQVRSHFRHISQPDQRMHYYADTGDGHSYEIDPLGDFSVGRWLWILEDIEPLKQFVVARGRQGLWKIDLAT